MLYPSPATSTLSGEDVTQAIRELAQFRYALRKFLRSAHVGEKVAGVTPRQQELLLGVAGFRRGERASITELAEFLQEKHNSVVELVDRAETSGLVRRESYPADRRVVLVVLTPRGKEAVNRVALVHRQQLTQLRGAFARLDRTVPGMSQQGRPTAAQERAKLEPPDFELRERGE